MILPKNTSKPDNLNVVFFADAKEWNKWLFKNHAASNGVWLKYFKKGSGKKSLTHSDAIDEALCYGWIDGQAKKFDEISWLQKFTKRRPKSIWSKRNTVRAEALIRLGKMKPAGLKEINVAKEDGRWGNAYDPPSQMRIPHDFLKRLSENNTALNFFESLNKTNKYSIAWKLQTAKKPETRENRMTKIIEMLSNGEKFH